MREYEIREVLNEEQIAVIIKRALGDKPWGYISSTVKPASTGLTGFLGDHYRVTLTVKLGSEDHILYIFVKTMPAFNKVKASFIDEGNFFRREMVSFQLFEELGGDEDPDRWRPKAYLYTESLLVMPDLTREGYTSRHFTETLDLEHVRIATASLARFHAAYTNFALRKSTATEFYDFYKEHSHIMNELAFCESGFIRAAAKLSNNLLQAFSENSHHKHVDGLEDKLTKLYVEASSMVQGQEGTLNVVLHRDLWMNNIMFRYQDGIPKNAVIVDYQCLKYGPPAFDLMTFLCLTTSREFRRRHENEIWRHYYTIFQESLGEATKIWLDGLGYDFQHFQGWCEKARMFGFVYAISIFPYVLMDPMMARHNFDDAETYRKYCDEDRSEPVLEYAKKNEFYWRKQVELTEEFIARYQIV